MNAECCMCKWKKNDITITRNPFGDLHLVCKECIPKWNKFWSEEE